MVKSLSANAGDVKKHGFNPWVGNIPWRRAWPHMPVFLPWRIPMDRRAWQTTVHGVAQSQDKAEAIEQAHRHPFS